LIILKKIFLSWLIFGALLFSIIGASENLKTKADNLIKTYFRDGANLKFERFNLSKNLKTKFLEETQQRVINDFLYVWKIYFADSTLGYALLDNAMGKSMPITFLVVFDQQGTIKGTHIVKYRETIGGEISNYSWNQQFKGKNKTSGFKIGTDIDGISGATISVQSITRGIRRLTFLFNYLKEEL